MYRALILMLIFPMGALAEEGKSYRWPKGFEGKQKLSAKRLVDLEASEGARQMFETENYRFWSDSEISNADWRAIMIVCEGVRGVLQSLPLDLLRPADHDDERVRAVVRFFSNEDEYRRAGGFPGSVGSYRGRGGEVLIWTRGLIEPDPEQGKFRLKRSQQYDLLVHELCHQALGAEFGRLPTWFSEGIAEYLAAAHTEPGVYSFRDPAGAVSSHVKKYLGSIVKKDRFEIVPLKFLAGSGGRSWANDNQVAQGRSAYLKYASALLLVHYFCHIDPERGQGDVIREFLGALRDGDGISQATVEKLLRGKSFDQIEGEIERFWQPKGLRLVFPE